MDDLSIKDLSELEIRNPLEESKRSAKKRSNLIRSRRSVQINGGMMNEEEVDEDIDGDEGIVNRRLPINSYNHQLQLNNKIAF